jgi:hypothetical protein
MPEALRAAIEQTGQPGRARCTRTPGGPKPQHGWIPVPVAVYLSASAAPSIGQCLHGSLEYPSAEDVKGESLMAAPAPAPAALPAPAVPPPSKTSDARVEQVRALAGLMAVMAGDVAIAVAAIVVIIRFAGSGTSSQALPQIVAILSGAFTAIGTMTTAYFGIKAMSNTAKNLRSS